ncbi:hypothetical protein MLD38_037851 [Melastoma candidum]|uniref:Uncharacterized protein n=1 Tax=Melastoma candidum TaxID=119954 RepID=A0ACB9LNX3_9MYRT|nr:hypothetical protein MLD38_037851 [Melastoma candidum]
MLPSAATSRLRNFNPIPFPSSRTRRYRTGLPRLFGSTNPCASICTDGRSARARARGFAATAAPSYSSRHGPCPDGRVSTQLGTVTRLLVHPASPVLLTENGPLGGLDSVARLNEAAAPSYLFKNSPSSFSYPEGNFRGNHLLDGSISLSPLYPSQTNDLHACSHSNPSPEDQGRSALYPRGDPTHQFPYALRVYHPFTRTHVRLLGSGHDGAPTLSGATFQ